MRKSMKRIDQITDAMQALGVYRQEYGQAILILAQLLDQYDALTKKFAASGYAYQMGEEPSSRKAPIVTTLEALRKDILSYLNALGLTPTGMKKIDVQVCQTQSGTLASALRMFSGDTG